jgi:hypothetical protein
VELGVRRVAPVGFGISSEEVFRMDPKISNI